MLTRASGSFWSAGIDCVTTNANALSDIVEAAVPGSISRAATSTCTCSTGSSTASDDLSSEDCHKSKPPTRANRTAARTPSMLRFFFIWTLRESWRRGTCFPEAGATSVYAETLPVG